MEDAFGCGGGCSGAGGTRQPFQIRRISPIGSRRTCMTTPGKNGVGPARVGRTRARPRPPAAPSDPTLVRDD